MVIGIFGFIIYFLSVVAAMGVMKGPWCDEGLLGNVAGQIYLVDILGVLFFFCILNCIFTFVEQ